MVSQSYIAACSNNCITPYATHAQEKLNLEVYYKRKIVEICEKIRRTNRYRTEVRAAGKEVNKEEESATPGRRQYRNGKMKKLKAVAVAAVGYFMTYGVNIG